MRLTRSMYLAILAGFVLHSPTVFGQMFTKNGGFLATTPTPVYAEPSAQSKVLVTLKPLDVVEILSREADAIRVKTHKTVHYREPEVNGKFRESGIEVEGWILKPDVVNMFPQNYERAVFFADIARLEKWSNAATRLLVCLHGRIIVGSTSTEVNCALGLPATTSEVETAKGKAVIQFYDCRSQSDTSKCNPDSDPQLVTLINGRVVTITRQK